jgi:hypothetical protein
MSDQLKPQASEVEGASGRTETINTAELVDLSEDKRTIIENKFDLKIPSEAKVIDKEKFDLLIRLQKQAEEGMWIDGEGGKKYMETGSCVVMAGKFIPPISEVLYDDVLEDVTSIYR